MKHLNGPFACIMLLSLATLTAPAFAQTGAAPAPTPTPTVSIPPALRPLVKHEVYASAAYITPPIICDQFGKCLLGARYQSMVYRGAAEFPIAGNALTGMVELDYRRFGYASRTLTARDTDYDYRAGIRVLEPRLYLAGSYLQRSSNYGFPRLRGYGFGLEKLPDVDQTFSLHGGVFYYPTVQGTYTNALMTRSLPLAYHVLRYDLGMTLKTSSYAPVFLEAGFLGDKSRNENNAPININRSGPYVGLGITF